MKSHSLLLGASLLCVFSLSACATAARTAISTAGVATKVAVGTAGAAGNVAIRTAGLGQQAVAAAATGAANGAAREGGKLAVRGVAAAGQAGFRAMTATDSSVSGETLAHRAGLTLEYPHQDLTVGNVLEEGTRTDYTVISSEGEAANCYVLNNSGTVSDAICRPAATSE